MLRSAEVFLKIWAVCLATFFVIIAKRELMSSSNAAVVASPVNSADGRRTRSLGFSATWPTAQLVNSLLEKVANLEYEVDFIKFVHSTKRIHVLFYIWQGGPRKTESQQEVTGD